MTLPVRQRHCAAPPAELAQSYADPPDGVRVNMILSLDGAAAVDGAAGPLSDETDQNLLLTLRGFADVVLVGAGTVRAEGYGPVRLTAGQLAERRRRWGTEAVPPIAVVTLTGDLPASLFADPARPPILVTTAELARSRPELAAAADLVVAGDGVVDIETAVALLRQRGLRRILCEGGPTLLEELIARDLVDEMCLTISPTLTAAPAAGRVGAARIPTRMALRHAVCIDDYVYVRYARPGADLDHDVTENGSDAT